MKVKIQNVLMVAYLLIPVIFTKETNLILFFFFCIACENAVELLFNAIMHLGCKPYLDSQRASCMCAYEEKFDL